MKSLIVLLGLMATIVSGSTIYQRENNTCIVISESCQFTNNQCCSGLTCQFDSARNYNKFCNSCRPIGYECTPGTCCPGLTCVFVFDSGVGVTGGLYVCSNQ